MDHLRSRPFGRVTIFTVPEYLREVRPAAYAPVILVMGPYHRERESPEIDECKIYAARHALLGLQTDFDDEIQKYTEMYDRKITMDSASLGLMLAKDASLLADLLVEYADRSYPLQTRTYDDYVLPRRYFWAILRDLMLMENQIPMELLWKTLGVPELRRTLYKLVTYIYPFRTFNPSRTETALPITLKFENCHHLLDCLYEACTRKSEPDPKAKRSDVQIPTATQLRAKGVGIRATSGDLSSIKFNARTGTLYLPEIKMYSETESWFRNLMAYEQCRNDLSVHWCSYIRIMTCLVDTAEDVKLLKENNVLISLVGSNDAVAEVWNKLGMNVELFLTTRDKDIMDCINKHCDSTWKVWLAEWLHLHFSRPWSVLSFLAALFVIGMQIKQTFFRRFLSYHDSN